MKNFWIIALVLGGIYVVLIPLAANGYGYVGYRGHYGGASFWYWGGPNIYGSPSARADSLNGTSRLGGGPGSGK